MSNLQNWRFAKSGSAGLAAKLYIIATFVSNIRLTKAKFLIRHSSEEAQKAFVAAKQKIETIGRDGVRLRHDQRLCLSS